MKWSSFFKPWNPAKGGRRLLKTLQRLKSEVQEVQRLISQWNQNHFSIPQAQELFLSLKQEVGLHGEAHIRIRACALLVWLSEKRCGETFLLFEEEKLWTIRFYPEQIFATLVLLEGFFAEQATGEGKTFSLLLAVFVKSFSCSQIHLLTANTYLAQRDTQFAQFLLEPFGISCATLQTSLSRKQKQALYHKQLLWGTLQDFIFDELQNFQVRSLEEQVSLRKECLFLDELDTVLIDEATLPFYLYHRTQKTQSSTHTPSSSLAVLQGIQEILVQQEKRIEEIWKAIDLELQKKPENPPFTKNLAYFLYLIHQGNPRHPRWFPFFQRYPQWVKPYLQNSVLFKTELLDTALWYQIQERYFRVFLTEKGEEFLKEHLGFDPYEILASSPFSSPSEESALEQKAQEALFLKDRLLFAHLFLEKDQHYFSEDQITVIENRTGRPHPQKKLKDGLHSALELKEYGHFQEKETLLAQSSLQNYLAPYPFFAGICGVAFPVQNELKQRYKKPLVPIPSHFPEIRQDFPTRCVATREEQENEVFALLQQAQEIGRPVLLGTRDTASCEYWAERLKAKGFCVQSLHAKNLNEESRILEQAGKAYQITVASKVAGRGTDIQIQNETCDFIARQCLKLIVQRLPAFSLLRLSGTLEKKLLEHYLPEYPQLKESLLEQDRFILRFGLAPPCGDSPPKILDFCPGLEVILVDFMDDLRSELQFRRRAGRQGAPGLSRVLLSLEDPLCRQDPQLLPGIPHFLKRLQDHQERLALQERERRECSICWDRTESLFHNLFYEIRHEFLETPYQGERFQSILPSAFLKDFSVLRERVPFCVLEILESWDRELHAFLEESEGLRRSSLFHFRPFEVHTRWLHEEFQEVLQRFWNVLQEIVQKGEEKSVYRRPPLSRSCERFLREMEGKKQDQRGNQERSEG
jgi:preprotein translocase subunit SecA